MRFTRFFRRYVLFLWCLIPLALAIRLILELF